MKKKTLVSGPNRGSDSILIWRDTKLIENLQEEYGWKAVTNYQQFWDTDFSQFSSIFMLYELNWDNHLKTKFSNGFSKDLLKALLFKPECFDKELCLCSLAPVKNFRIRAVLQQYCFSYLNVLDLINRECQNTAITISKEIKAMATLKMLFQEINDNDTQNHKSSLFGILDHWGGLVMSREKPKKQVFQQMVYDKLSIMILCVNALKTKICQNNQMADIMFNYRGSFQELSNKILNYILNANGKEDQIKIQGLIREFKDKYLASGTLCNLYFSQLT